jgi:hypothetical protein
MIWQMPEIWEIAATGNIAGAISTITLGLLAVLGILHMEFSDERRVIVYIEDCFKRCSMFFLPSFLIYILCIVLLITYPSTLSTFV